MTMTDVYQCRRSVPGCAPEEVSLESFFLGSVGEPMLTIRNRCRGYEAIVSLCNDDGGKVKDRLDQEEGAT
jgi:hypothetical protein